MEKRSCGIAVVQQFMMLLTWDMPGTAVPYFDTGNNSAYWKQKVNRKRYFIQMSVLLENSLVTLNTLDLRLKACYTMSLCDLKLISG